jgi:short-subunit dehydrogenase
LPLSTSLPEIGWELLPAPVLPGEERRLLGAEAEDPWALDGAARRTGRWVQALLGAGASYLVLEHAGRLVLGAAEASQRFGALDDLESRPFGALIDWALEPGRGRYRTLGMTAAGGEDVAIAITHTSSEVELDSAESALLFARHLQTRQGRLLEDGEVFYVPKDVRVGLAGERHCAHRVQVPRASGRTAGGAGPRLSCGAAESPAGDPRARAVRYRGAPAETEESSLLDGGQARRSWAEAGDGGRAVVLGVTLHRFRDIVRSAGGTMTESTPSPRPTALVTGASGGIGADLARELARHGHDLILVARTQPALDAVAREISAAHGVRAEVLTADLADPAAPDALFAEVMRRGFSVDVLVNNAGLGGLAPFAEQDPAVQRQMLTVNVEALTRLSRLFLPAMVQRGRGRVLNVPSTAGFFPGPGMAVYYASKAYVISLSVALANELEPRGITVTCLCPGATKTRFDEVAGSSRSRLFTGPGVMSSPDSPVPEQAARGRPW